jgi:phosphatidylserine/phosphatidylglycerophosphate/cardiolipin synthase-like enzyme
MIRACCLILMLLCPAAGAAPQLEDAFSPEQGATSLVLRTVGEAKHSIRVAAYSFTSHPIAEALVAAQGRGVNVMVVLDKSQREGRGSLFAYLLQNSVPTRINEKYHIMHDKFIIVDDSILETGSFNFTAAAENANAENILVVREAPAVIADYLAQWGKLWAEAN